MDWLTKVVQVPLGTGAEVMAFISRCRFVTAMLSVFVFGGCTYLPEYVDPIDWVDSANEWVTGSILGDEEVAGAGGFEETAIPGEEDPFPSLTSVPDDRPSIRSLEERHDIANELISDRENARYDDTPVASSPEPAPESSEIPVASIHRDETPRDLDVTKPEGSATEVERAPTIALEPSVGTTYDRVAPNVPQEEFVVSPPAVPDVPTWSSVEDSFNDMFQASGGAGSVETVRGSPTGTYREEIVASTAGVDTSRVHAAVIYFSHGSAKLSKADKKVLKEVAVAVGKSGGYVSVVGHASSRTKTNDVLKHNLVNYETSLARAESVAKELIRQGIPSDRVSAYAMADDQPSYSEATKLGEAANRRANVYVDF